MLLYELSPGKSTLPQRHLFEEVVYVVQGSGNTQLELPNGERRSFEWGETVFSPSRLTRNIATSMAAAPSARFSSARRICR